MDLFALLAKGKALLAAIKSGDLRTAADLAGDFLKLASQFLPSKPAIPATGDGPLMPLTMPDSSDLLTLLTLLMRIFGKK